MLFVDGESVIFKNGVGQQMDGVQADRFHLATAFADQVAVTMLRLAQGEAHLIFGAGHQVHDAHLVQPFKGAINGGDVEPGQRLLDLLKNVAGGYVSVMIFRMQDLQSF